MKAVVFFVTRKKLLHLQFFFNKVFKIRFLWPSMFTQSKNLFPTVCISLAVQTWKTVYCILYTLHVYNQTIYSNIQSQYMRFFKLYYIQKRRCIYLKKEVHFIQIYILYTDIQILYIDIYTN